MLVLNRHSWTGRPAVFVHSASSHVVLPVLKMDPHQWLAYSPRCTYQYLISITIEYILSGTHDVNKGTPRKLQRCLQCPLCLHDNTLRNLQAVAPTFCLLVQVRAHLLLRKLGVTQHFAVAMSMCGTDMQHRGVLRILLQIQKPDFGVDEEWH